MSKKLYIYLPPSYCSLDLKILLNEKDYDPYLAPFDQLYEHIAVPHNDVIYWLYDNFNIWVYSHRKSDKWIISIDYVNKKGIHTNEPLVTNQSDREKAYDAALIKVLSEML